jgi:hypothetical protein
MEHDPDGARWRLRRRLDPVSVYFILFLARPGEKHWLAMEYADGSALTDLAGD